MKKLRFIMHSGKQYNAVLIILMALKIITKYPISFKFVELLVRYTLPGKYTNNSKAMQMPLFILMTFFSIMYSSGECIVMRALTNDISNTKIYKRQKIDAVAVGVIKMSNLLNNISGTKILIAFTIRYMNKIPSAALSALHLKRTRKAPYRSTEIEKVVMFIISFTSSKVLTPAILIYYELKIKVIP